MIRNGISLFLLVVMLQTSSGLGSCAVSPIEGHWALQQIGPSVRGELLAQPLAGDLLGRRLSIWMTKPGSSEPLRRYVVHATKLLHLIIVSDDFRQFIHVHPMLGSDGRFTIAQHFLTPGLYHLYADSMPEGMENQVVRFDLPIAGGKAAPERSLPGGLASAAGPYTIAVNTTKVKAGSDAVLRFHFSENGKPAGDLHPYLGELFHAIILNVQDESYVHAHPMPLQGAEKMQMGDMGDMGGMPMANMPMKDFPDSMVSPPDMLLHVRIPRPGTYKMWVHFRGGSELHVAEFVLTAA